MSVLEDLWHMPDNLQMKGKGGIPRIWILQFTLCITQTRWVFGTRRNVGELRSQVLVASLLPGILVIVIVIVLTTIAIIIMVVQSPLSRISSPGAWQRLPICWHKAPGIIQYQYHYQYQNFSNWPRWPNSLGPMGLKYEFMHARNLKFDKLNYEFSHQQSMTLVTSWGLKATAHFMPIRPPESPLPRAPSSPKCLILAISETIDMSTFFHDHLVHPNNFCKLQLHCGSVYICMSRTKGSFNH